MADISGKTLEEPVSALEKVMVLVTINLATLGHCGRHST